MREELWKELVISYGTQIEKHKGEITNRLNGMFAALLFVGTLGDTPLAKLNRAFLQVEQGTTTQEANTVLKSLLQQIMSALPTKRDWLDPDLEKQIQGELK